MQDAAHVMAKVARTTGDGTAEPPTHHAGRAVQACVYPLVYDAS